MFLIFCCVCSFLHFCISASLGLGHQQQESHQHPESCPQLDNCHQQDSYQKPEAEEVLISKLDSMDKEIIECEEDVKNLGEQEVCNLKIVSTI